MIMLFFYYKKLEFETTEIVKIQNNGNARA